MTNPHVIKTLNEWLEAWLTDESWKEFNASGFIHEANLSNSQYPDDAYAGLAKQYKEKTGKELKLYNGKQHPY